MNYNKCIFVGHLTKDIESGSTTTGTLFAKSGIAVNSGYGDKQTVMFIDFVCWGKTSEFLAKNFSKGKCILIEGELKLESWEDKNGGGKRSKHTVNVSSVNFAGGKKDNDVSVAVAETKQEDSNESIPF